MSILLVALLVVFVLDKIEKDKIDKFWEEWERQSFEFEGGRFNKDFYEIVDGKLKEKK